MSDEPLPAGSAIRSRTHAIFWSTVAVVPFLLYPAFHRLANGSEATGLTTYDLPYYAANAQAVLHRGRLGTYPNAFDPDPAAPSIYLHWLIDVLAVLIGPMGIDPGAAFLLLQVVGAWASARLMFSLVRTLWGDRPLLTPLYLLTMWGGGLLIVGRLVLNLLTGLSWNESLLAFDPGQGLWCLNFGRNLILPTEAVYHALMIALWLAILRERWAWAAISLWLVATTHPFTGAQAIAIVVGWMALQAVTTRQLPPRSFLVNTVAVGVAFASYYFVFLPSFPAHRALREVWTLEWVLTGPMMLLAYGPALLLALAAVRRDQEWARRTLFLATAAGVSFLLANHHWFMTPQQPIHFTRGYIWTPLWLIGLPSLAAIIGWCRRQTRVRQLVAAGVLGIFIVFDNAAFLAISARRGKETGFTLTANERQAFQEIKQLRDPGILLTETDRLGYLAAAYTSARPYFGHKYNTPQFEERSERVQRFLKGTADTALLNEANLVLTKSPVAIRQIDRAGWHRLGEFGELQLWTRRSPN